MIKVENIDVWGWEHAVRAMRNPMNSWDKSDSDSDSIGDADLALMKKLVKAGVEHRTFARMVMVSMDITAPLYWWKEADRYRFKEQISTSTMHKVHAKKFTLDDFSHEHLIFDSNGNGFLTETIDALNIAREVYLYFDELYKNGALSNKVQCKKDAWWQMIQLLPSSYNQRRTVMMSYETCMKMIKERSGHKLDEWNDFVKVLENLPYMRRLME